MPETLSSDILKREAFYLADLIIYRYTSENGGLFEKVDINDGKAVGFECAVDELGDYIQYIAYLGILTSKKEYVDWTLNTATLIAQNYQSKKGLFYNRLGRNFIRKNLLSLNNADTITGLVSAHIYTNSDLLRPIIIKFIEGAFRSFTKNYYLTYGYIFDDKISVSLSSLLFSAYFIEEVLYFMEHEAGRENFVKIKEVIDANLSNRFF